jgi:PST family polysaccharide transporter
MWADSLIVGIYLGSHDLGLYQTGNQFTLMAFAILFGPITPVLYSHLSKIGQDKERMRAAAIKVIKAIAFVSIPVAMVIFSVAQPLAMALLGEKWRGIEVVIGTMALMHGFSWVMGMNGEVYRAMGKPSREAIVSAVSLLVYLVVYLYSVRHGLEAFLWARLGLALWALLLHLMVIRALLAVNLLPIAQYLVLIALVSGVPALGLRFLLVGHLGDPWWQLAWGGILNLFLVAGVLFFVERDGMLKELRSMFKNATS